MNSRKISRRVVAALAALVLTVVLFAVAAPAFSVRAAYENTHVNTGNQAQDLIAVAKTQLGYAEGSNNYNKYSESFGYAYQPWCGHFISWCARQAGIPEAVIPTTGRSTAFFTIGDYHSRLSGYIPQPGDIMLYGVYGDSYHVSIVERFDKTTSTVYVLDGNWSDKVSSHSTTLANTEVAGFVTPPYTSDVAELTALNMVTPSVIAAGSGYSVSGYITSPNTITSVNVTVADENGQVCISENATPNATSYDLSSLDSKIKFGSLAVGSYAYTVTATDTEQTKRWAYVFDVVSEVQMTFSNETLPTKLDVGKSFSIYGKITCAEPLLNVSVSVYDVNDVYKTGGTASPNTTTYDIHGIDNYVSFGKLPEGHYTVVVAARSANGTGRWEYPFVVGNPPALVTKFTLDNVTIPETLSYGADITLAGTLTADDTISEVIATVMTEAGTAMFQVTATPNTTVFELAPLDSTIAFNTLSVGSYVLILEATALNGSQKWEYPFTVSSDVTYTLTNEVYPTALEPGVPFSIKGTVGCSEALTKITIEIYNGNAEILLTASKDLVDVTTADVSVLDAAIKFGSLEVGRYCYHIVATSANSSMMWEYPFTVGDPDELIEPTYTLTDETYPTSLVVGSTFSVGGIVTCDEPLTAVTVKVVDATGAVKIEATESPNGETFDIKTLDKNVAFGSLAAGNYTYQIVAQSEHGEQTWEYPFTVTSDVVITLDNPEYPTHLEEGASCSISGVLTANKPMTRVTVSVVDMAGQVCLTASGTPNATTYRIGYLDTSMKFGSLKTGRYIYTICAETASGSQTWEYAFTVGDVADDLLFGDVYTDGQVNSMDVMTLYRHVSGAGRMDAKQLMYVGVDNVNMTTVLALYNYVAGKATQYP
ncbi:MAG: CHAP domain-containing protein [Clostridia bacterium]|nr:CHAP domain-containing protein [Clostridia bacterium]